MITPVSFLSTSKIRKIVDLPSLQARWRTDQGVLNLSSEAPSPGDSVLSWTSFEGKLGAKALTRNTAEGNENLKWQINQQNDQPLIMDNINGGAFFPYEYRSLNESAFGGISEMTVIMVVNVQNSNDHLIFHDTSYGNQGVWARVKGTGQLRITQQITGATSDSSETGLFGSIKLIVMRFKPNEMLARINATGLTLNNQFAGRTWSPQNFAIGRDNGFNPINDVAYGEILIYDKALNLPQITAIEEKLNEYWAIY
jgi:hypothetical protein